jgi:hypothetical protein
MLSLEHVDCFMDMTSTISYTIKMKQENAHHEINVLINVKIKYL